MQRTETCVHVNSWECKNVEKSTGVPPKLKQNHHTTQTQQFHFWDCLFHVQMNLAFLLVLWVSSLLPYPRGQFQ